MNGRSWTSRLVRRAVGAVVGVAFAAAALTGCQEATNVRVRNACSAAFEAAVSEVRDPTERGYGLDWTQIPSGSSEHMVMATETTEAVFVWLRAADADTIPTPVRKVINPTGRWQDAEDEVTIVVLDKECPQA